MELTDQIKREIGQHFVVGFHGYSVGADIEALIRDYYVGNIIIMRRNVQSARQIHALLHDLQRIAKNAGHERPLMIGTDQENGLVSTFTLTDNDAAGTQFPGAMALGAACSPDLVERVSEASAKELKLVGMNWAYSPVADVNGDPRNPVIGVRSFGDVPEEVAKYVAAVCRGLTKAGVAPSPKHFPGHGDTHVDSHLSLPVIRKDATSLAQTDLVPFRTASNAAVATIMVGHIALPTITSDTTPASLSRVVINDMLRESLGYDGVAVTDCLEMGAIAAREGGVPAAAVHALQAGADIAMICHRFDRQRDALEAVYNAVRNGTLDREQLRLSGKRIAALKDAFAGDWAQVLGRTFDEAVWSRLKAENALLSRHAYASSIALVRNPHDVIPLPKADGGSRGGGIVVVLTPRMKSSELLVADTDDQTDVPGPSCLSFAAGVSRRLNGASMHSVYSSEPLSAELCDAIDRGTVSSVLFVTRNANRSTWQLDRLRDVLRRLGKGNLNEGSSRSTWRPDRLRDVLRRLGKGNEGSSRRKATVVVLASCGPYDLLPRPAAPSFKEEGTEMGLDEVAYLVSFEYTRNALDAAAGVIFGEEDAKGRVPVCGGNIFP